MRARGDPLLPLLASAVSLVLVGFLAFVFFPRLARWFGPEAESVHGEMASPTDAVPVWVSRDVPGVALLIRPGVDGGGEGGEAGFAEWIEGEPCSLLTLFVYNFDREAPFDLALPAEGFASPEGGEPALPAARVLKPDLPARLRPVLLGLGAVAGLSVPKGHAGQALLAVRGDPARRTAFVSGPLRFERRELPRRTLARWQQRPAWKEFEEF